MDQAITPDLGQGPWGVEQEGNLWYLTLNGTRESRTPILAAKSAYRACRQRNERHADHEPEIKVSKSNPPSGEGTSKSNPPERKPKAKVKASKPAPKAAPKDEPKPKASKADPALAMFNGTREEWLNAFVAAARPEFEKRGFKLPEKVRVSVGFTGSRGGGKVLGACWHEAASADGTREIFVVPTVDDSSRIADIVTHELCHTLFGPDEKHGKNFKAAAFGMGLEGKATATVAGDGWREWANPILEALGRIPHAALDPSQSGQKKQSTRLIKCECEECGFVFRTTAKWINGRVLRCPDEDCDGSVKVEISEGGEGE